MSSPYEQYLATKARFLKLYDKWWAAPRGAAGLYERAMKLLHHPVVTAVANALPEINGVKPRVILSKVRRVVRWATNFVRGFIRWVRRADASIQVAARAYGLAA